MEEERPLVASLRIRGSYPNHRNLSARDGEHGASHATRSSGYAPPIVEYTLLDERSAIKHETSARDVDLPLLCQVDEASARRHLDRILGAQRGDPVARTRLDASVDAFYGGLRSRVSGLGLVENRYVIPSSSGEDHDIDLVSDKAATLLRLTRLGYPVPDFVILTSNASVEWEANWERFLTWAFDDLQALTLQRLGGSDDPLLFAIRAAMPYYIPGFMPTYLNVGLTEGALPGLREKYGAGIANRILLTTLRNLVLFVDPALHREYFGVHRYFDARQTVAADQRLFDAVAAYDRKLLEDPLYQTVFFLNQVRQFYDDNADVLLTLSRGKRSLPSVILQKMVCSIRADESYAGVVFSRHSKTGMGKQLQIGRNLFGEDIMTGTVEPEEFAFTDREDIRHDFPAVHHFVPQLEALEREFESPVTVEFATENTKRHQLFAVLQLNREELTGRGAFISVVDMHQAGIISRRRVTELIAPYHVKQIESDAIDVASLDTLDLFCQGVSILPRRAMSARVYFGAEKALQAKKRGEAVCFCRRTFEPSDTVVMREMDAILSVTAAAIHVVTICQSFGAPALLSLERFGATLTPDQRLVNAEGKEIREGDWITISSRRQSLYRGSARFKPARLLRMMRGERVDLEPHEKELFEAMAYAYRYYQQMVRGMKLDQISRLNELIRLVNLELRGQVDEARGLVRGWFDSHEALYVDEVFASDMGDHLNQSTVFDMLTPDRKIRFFRAALEKCRREQLQGYAAGAFMLGRFVSMPQPISFWTAFAPLEIGLLVNEWVLFEKYMLVLHQVGERKIVRAKKKILEEGLDEVPLDVTSVKGLITLKLAKVSLPDVRAALPATCDPQARQVLELLEQPYGRFYDFGAKWSVVQLENLCAAQGVPVPGPEDA